jgi:hypothetical protein
MTHAVASVVQRAKYVIWRKTMTPNEVMKIRAKAASYAQSFLANKYYEEYKELYDAYLINRGVTTRRSRVMADERVVTSE